MKTRVVHLVDETLEHPVLRSQSLAVMARLLEAGVIVDLLVANGVDAASEKNIARKFLGASSRVGLLSKRYRGSTVLAKAQRTMRRALARRRAARFIQEAGPLDEPIVLHARGSATRLGAYLRKQFDRTRLVADIRGDSAAEARFSIGGTEGERRATAVERMDARVFSRADHLICVSEALLFELRKRFTLSCGATVIPCVADERRFFSDVMRRREAREALGLSSEPLLIYAGSIGQWHQFESTLETFDLFSRKNSQAKYLVVTRDGDGARALVAARPGLRERTIVRSGDADEVARWLSAADIGLLLRADHPLNGVACPTKFAEYVLSGLSVVISEGIGDLAGWVRGLDLGLCVNGSDAAGAASACDSLLAGLAANSDRAARAQRASSALSIGARLQDWVEAYRSALQRMPA